MTNPPEHKLRWYQYKLSSLFILMTLVGVGDDQYIECLQYDLDAIDSCFEPQLVCYVAGADPVSY